MRLILLTVLCFTRVSLALSESEWADRIIKVSDLSLQTLLSSELIKKTDSPNVYEVNIDQAVILPKEALAAHVLSHAIDKPILLLTALPGFSETPIVDAIVYSKDQASPEFNVSFKSVEKPKIKTLRTRINRGRLSVRNHYSEQGLNNLYVQKGIFRGGNDLPPSYLEALRRALGVEVRPVALSVDFLSPAEVKPIVRTVKGRDRIEIYGPGAVNSRGISIERINSNMKKYPWLYYYFISRDSVLEVDSSGWREFEVKPCDWSLAITGNRVIDDQ